MSAHFSEKAAVGRYNGNFKFQKINTMIEEAQKLHSIVDGTEGTIFFYGLIGQEDPKKESITIMDLVKKLSELEAAGIKTCHIRINSPGGSVYNGTPMMANIRASKMVIHTWNDGLAYSMAADLWLCAKKENRHMAKNATIMFHKPSTIVQGNSDMIETALNDLRLLDEGFIDIMSDLTGLSKAVVRTEFYTGGDKKLGYQKCIEFGLMCDDGGAYIGEPLKESDTTQESVFDYIKKFSKMLFPTKNIEIVLDNSTVSTPNEAEKQEQIMDKNTIAEALKTGKFTLAELQALVVEEEAKVPMTKGDFLKMQKEQNDAFETKIALILSKFGGQSGGTPPKAVGNPNENAGDPTGAQTVDAALLAQLNASNQAAEDALKLGKIPE
jgi:ATP-dependent protease ClpP protease subunit